MRNGGILALSLLFLLTLASQGSWCAAESSTSSISADHHLQVQEFHGKKNLEMVQSPRKLGHGPSLTKHEVTAVEIKHQRRMAIGHKGGSVGGGGGAVTRPHNNTKNGVSAALRVPASSVLLVLCLASGLALSVFSF